MSVFKNLPVQCNGNVRNLSRVDVSLKIDGFLNYQLKICRNPRCDEVLYRFAVVRIIQGKTNVNLTAKDIIVLITQNVRLVVVVVVIMRGDPKRSDE